MSLASRLACRAETTRFVWKERFAGLHHFAFDYTRQSKIFLDRCALSLTIMQGATEAVCLVMRGSVAYRMPAYGSGLAQLGPSVQPALHHDQAGTDTHC